jgi:pimeloyl-ACP methyl ester carboxylesterase
MRNHSILSLHYSHRVRATCGCVLWLSFVLVQLYSMDILVVAQEAVVNPAGGKPVTLDFITNDAFREQERQFILENVGEAQGAGDDGSKPAIVLLHGVYESAYTYADFLIQPASSSSNENTGSRIVEWPAIALSMRGFGHSPLGSSGDAASDRADVGPELMIKDIRKTLIELKLLM